MKIILKKTLIILLLICILIPSLFSGFAIATDAEIPLTQERAGNYVANFAINFFENWSSSKPVKAGDNKGIFVAGEYGWPLTDGDTFIGSDFKATEPFRNGVPHNGLDITPNGDKSRKIKVYAVSDGEILDAKSDITESNNSEDAHSGMGNYIKIQNGDLQIRYMHLKKVSDDILNGVGTKIIAGTYLGEMGNTGNSRGKHLHIDFSVTNEQIARTFNTTYLEQKGRYYLDPNSFISSENISEVSSNSSVVIRGKVKTKYNYDATADSIKEDDETYEFSNKSWIEFVYQWSLNMKENSIITGNNINSEYFDNTEEIFGDELDKTTDILDISKLISEGQVVPGDILYIYNGVDSGEYVLYVGGSKIIYATPTETVPNTVSENSIEKQVQGALKYEYLQYYMQSIKRNLLSGHEEDDDYIVPKYGVTKIYRINKETANSKTEQDTNLIFNGKGYYSPYTKYDGTPLTVGDSQIAYGGSTSMFTWVFNFISDLFELIINTIIYMVRMQIVGWANIAEMLIQNVVLGISGNNGDGGYIDKFFGTNATSSGERISVESIFFNKIPILDANFFNFETAGGYSLRLQEDENSTQENSEETQMPLDEQNVVYQLRKNLATWYVLIRNISIAIMLFILLYLGIRLAITSSSEKKADYKKHLTSWCIGMCVIFFLHFFMYAVFQINDTLVGICKDWSNRAAETEVSELLEKSEKQEELNLYEAIRIKAYAFNWEEGVPGTIIYVFLVYLLVRFLVIYLKRYFTIYILAISGSFMGVKYALEGIAGKKTGSLNKWLKDFSFNVLLQTVHAFLYVLFMSVALSVSQTSLAGAAVGLVILNFMLKSDTIIVKIFGLDKAGSLAEVNNPESFSELMHKVMPMYTIGNNIPTKLKNMLLGDYGAITQIQYATTGKDNIRDAKKELEKRKYERIGKRWRRISKVTNSKFGRAMLYIPNRLPIRRLGKYAKYKRMLGNNLSADTNKKIYEAIKGARKLNKQKFTRRVKTIADFGIGTAGIIAGAAMFIGRPDAGFSLMSNSKRKIDKYRTTNNIKKRNSKYGAKTAVAKRNKDIAERNYNLALDKYANNEVAYQERREELQDDYRKALPNTPDKARISQEIKDLDEQRKIEASKELHEAQEAYEKAYEAKVLYGNAKHEKNKINKVLTAVGTAIGASVVADMAMTDGKANLEAIEKATKQEQKLEDLSKVAELEQELRKLNKQLKQEQERYARDNNITKEESDKLLEKQLGKTVKESKKMNINSGYIKQVVSDYLFEKGKDKVTGDDVEDILIRLQYMMSSLGKEIEFNDDVKSKVKKELESKMVKKSKGLGFDSKDATTAIREALGKDGVLESNSLSDIEDDRIRSLHEQILQKIKDINTYDQVGKIKYKQSLISINKIIKDAEKQ